MTHIHVLAHIKRVRLPATRPAVDDLAASGEATSRDAQRLLGSPEPVMHPGFQEWGDEPWHMAYWNGTARRCSVPDCEINQPLRSPAEPITARPAIPLRGGDRSVGSAGVPRGSLPDVPGK